MIGRLLSKTKSSGRAVRKVRRNVCCYHGAMFLACSVPATSLIKGLTSFISRLPPGGGGFKKKALAYLLQDLLKAVKFQEELMKSM